MDQDLAPEMIAARLGIVLQSERIARMKQQGFWTDERLVDCLDRAVLAHPDAEAIVSARKDGGHVKRLTYRELAGEVERIAAGLAVLGAQPGTIVSVQLPCWWQFAAIVLACTRLGCIVNPLMPTARAHELKAALSLCDTRILFIPRSFRQVDYPSLLDGLRKDLPGLRYVVVVDEAAPDGFEGLPSGGGIPKTFTHADAVTEIMFTSGTTGAPKGVMQTSNTLLAATRAFAERNGLGADDTIFMASPLAHQTGYLWGIFLPIFLGARVVYLDQWVPQRAAQLIAAERATFSVAAPTFLTDLLGVQEAEGADLGSLNAFLLAGAPVPKVLVERAAERLGVRIGSAWGMTEVALVTISHPSDSAERVSATDGAPLPGTQIRIVNSGGVPVPPRVEGRLQARGPFNFVGYLKRPDLNDTDADGWFETGDLGYVDDAGYLRITGRAKDIVIRGGEKIPVADVENVLYRHPAIADAAIVAVPDPRLGERACAYVTLRGTDGFDMAEMTRFLAACGVTRTYFPERLEIIAEMPRTASGKIQKFLLRQRAEVDTATASAG
ncbi:AMP-binding protein [Xanthobacter aminoxidans]|uniref:AMP-binding protein n=1 Tax=Xanthobacter aminoxidans TaxID=186280 RepID=UPI0020231894|nr:AMP-binding protein [Xanthobacter aminoxidans]MCL8383550.1 AMP-binding protein [Xanthobacter aminoxidans]